MAWRCRFLAARPSQAGVHPTHWLISTQSVTVMAADDVSQRTIVPINFVSVVAVVTCVEITILRRFVLNSRVLLHAIDATPARWRGDAGSSPLNRISNAPDALVDFHTGRHRLEAPERAVQLFD